MKLRAKLMIYTAAAALTAHMAFAAIDPQTLADEYIGWGYSYVEIKQGPTQTKVEAVKGDVKIEVIYDNASGEIIKEETEAAGDYAGRTGVEIDFRDEDFEDNDDENDDDEDEDDNDDDEDEDDNDDDEDEDEDEDDDHDDDSGSDDDDDDSGDDSNDD